MVKRSLGPEAKKEYVKPLLTRNDLLVDITFSSPVTVSTVSTAITETGGSPSTLVGGPVPKAYRGYGGVPEMPGEIGGGGDYGTAGGGGTIAGTGGTIAGGGTIIPGTGGAPGTVL